MNRLTRGAKILGFLILFYTFLAIVFFGVIAGGH